MSSDLIARINAARGISSELHPSIVEMRRLKALTRSADYATCSVETRPWISHSLNNDDLIRLVAKRKQAAE